MRARGRNNGFYSQIVLSHIHVMVMVLSSGDSGFRWGIEEED